MMDMSLTLYFIVGAVVCFVGTLPFGPINLTVVKITVDKDYWRGLEVALAASIVEMFQAIIAIWFGMVIGDFLSSNLLFRLLVAVVFVALGIFVWTRQPKEKMQAADVVIRSEFKTGLAVASLNPQAIPFWIFALALISDYVAFQYDGIFLVAFLAGIFIGKLLALSGFVLLSQYLKTHLRQSGLIVNRLLATVLLLIGTIQLLRIVTQ